MKYRLFFLVLSFFSCAVYSFEYRQQMIEYKGGLVSQLNNCGVNYSSNGYFLRGLNRLTANLNRQENTIVAFHNIQNSIVSVLDDGRVFLSPDGRSLDGGNDTVLIDSIPRQVSGPRLSKIDNKILGLAAHNDSVAVLTSHDGLYVYAGVTQGQVIRKKINLTEIPRINVGGRIVEGNPISPIYIGATDGINGRFYIQYDNGSVKFISSIDNLINGGSLTLLTSNMPRIQQILKYDGGVLTLLSDSKIYYSTSSSNLLATLKYSGTRKIASVLNLGGDASAGGSKGLYVNFLDGYTVYSPDGLSLTGGGRSVIVASPIDLGALKSVLQLQFDRLNAGYINFAGDYVVKYSLSVKILNKGDDTVYDGSWAAGFNGSNLVVANAADLLGNPARMRIYDKGWDGLEYKWRDRGEQVGTIIATSEFEQIGNSEIKFKSVNSCVVVSGISQIGESPNPWTKKIAIEPKSFYSEVNKNGPSSSGTSFYIGLLKIGRDLVLGDYGWNVWTFLADAGSLGAMISYYQYKYDVDLTGAFTGQLLNAAKKLQNGPEDELLKSNYVIRHKTSGMCLHPKGGAVKPAVGTQVVLDPYCNPFEERLLFTILPNGSLQHVSSGLCVHPEGGTASVGRRLVLWNSCSDGVSEDNAGNKRLSFKFLTNEILKHTNSGLCVHPSGGAARPPIGTELVLWTGCDDERLKYSRY